MNKEKVKTRWQLLDKQVGTETPERVKKRYFPKNKNRADMDARSKSRGKASKKRENAEKEEMEREKINKKEKKQSKS